MIEFASTSTVKLIDHMGSDDSVIRAAQVSAKGENNPDTVPYRLINALMKHRHGSPFEHNAFTFFIETPIFVVREWQRHRISSFNEMSGRYTEMKPKFYIPDEHRPIVNIGSSMKPIFEHNLQATMDVQGILNHQCEDAWNHYTWMIDQGIAKEVARMTLPLNTYTQMYWTVNARSLMNFLSLRIQSCMSTYLSYPQFEIHEAALQIEEIFAKQMPLTHKSFVENGRVAP